MPLPPPVIDHLVIDARDCLDAAAAAFAELGFQLTPRGHHTLGSANHLAVFATDYLELLGFGSGGTSRPELAQFPAGLNGLVFKTEDADSVHRHASAAGLPVLPVQAFSRPVEIDGVRQEARFRTARLDPAKTTLGRIYFCEHRTPELVWRKAWQTHSNGARAIGRVVVAAAEPHRTAALFAALFGVDSLRERDGVCAIPAGAAQIELVSPARIAEEFGAAAPVAAGRADYLAAIELKVGSLETAGAVLRNVPGVASERGRAVVAAASAFNTALSFTA
jgi:hypothetical protein